MNAAPFLNRLEKVRSRGHGKWSARCPAHQDRSPSLSIQEIGQRILLHCFGGCEPVAIVEALGLQLRDLFTDNPTHSAQRSTAKPQKLDLSSLVFRFELAALDRRLRAERVLKKAIDLSINAFTEVQLDRALNAITRAYIDIDRATFLESVADDFRLKAFHKRTEHHAA